MDSSLAQPKCGTRSRLVPDADRHRYSITAAAGAATGARTASVAPPRRTSGRVRHATNRVEQLVTVLAPCAAALVRNSSRTTGHTLSVSTFVPTTKRASATGKPMIVHAKKIATV